MGSNCNSRQPLAHTVASTNRGTREEPKGRMPGRAQHDGHRDALEMSSQDPFTSFAKAAAYAPPPTSERPPMQHNQSSNFVSPQYQNPQNAGPSMYASTSSYQAGGIPTWGNTASGGGGGYDAEGQEGPVNQWETRFGWRVDVVAAAAYLLGPITGTRLRTST